MYFPMVEAQKISKTKTDQQVDPFSPPLDVKNNLFLGLWLFLYKQHCIISCMNSLITAGPRQSPAASWSCTELRSENTNGVC